MPEDAPEDWLEFRDVYLKADIDSMEELYHALPKLSAWEQQVWVDTQHINLRGIPIDVPTTKLIIEKLDSLVDEESSNFIRIAGVFPSQRDKVLGWVRANGVKATDLQAETVEKIIQAEDTPEHVRKALEARANTTHMSFKKFPKMLEALRDNGTVGGTLMYHAAGTGRFGGRLLQPQNLTRGSINGVEAVNRIHAGEFSVELVKSAVRPMIYHPAGFTIVDYVGVEARGVQWLCRDEDALDVFRTGQDPYIWMAGKIYRCEYNEVTEDQRFVGKQAILGLGYQMSAKKFKTMVEGYNQEISVSDANRAVEVYRSTHKKLVQFWDHINQAALMAMDNLGDDIVLNKYISFRFDNPYLTMKLPSGRRIYYFKPNVDHDSYGRSISYLSTNDKYVRTHTYGGKLVENAVQGLCRDLLVHGVRNLHANGIEVITHVHDETVTLGMQKEIVSNIMSILPDWALGFPLQNKAVESSRYIKA
jgi:DNA polymerase